MFLHTKCNTDNFALGKSSQETPEAFHHKLCCVNNCTLGWVAHVNFITLSGKKGYPEQQNGTAIIVHSSRSPMSKLMITRISFM